MEILGYSNSQKHRILYKWRIDEIIPFIESSKKNRDTVKLKSSNFTTNGKTKNSWYLELQLLSERGWISIYLCQNNAKDKVRTKLSLFILDGKNERKFIKTSYENRYFKNGAGCPKFLEIKHLLDNEDDLLPNNTLTICVELIIYDDYKSCTTELPLQTPQRQITDDLKELYDSKTNSDVILTVGDKTFKAHKLILSTRSPVFFAMFTHEMKEKTENAVTIPDINPEIFEKILKFIYTDSIDDLDADAEYLLESADKYQLLKLKSLCEQSLSKSASIDNAIQLMILADLYDANQLFECALELIIRNIDDVIKTSEYRVLEESYPLLFSKLIKKLVTSIKFNASADEK